jgi:translocation and assembly module TamA
MGRRDARIALAATLLSAWPATNAMAQPAPAETAPLDAPAFDPRAPLPEIPEIEAEWREFLIDAPDAAPTTDTAAPTALRYQFAIAPIQKFPFSARFRALSSLVAGRGKPVDSLAELQRRVREDTDLLRRLFRAEGFYDPDIAIEIDPAARDGVVTVTTTLDPGPRYRIARIDIALDDAGERDFVRSKLGLSVDDPLTATALNAALDRLRIALPESGFPFARVADPDIVVDHDTRTATYALDVRLGASSRFGTIEVAGDPLFSAKHLGRLARFKPGDRYDAAQVEDLRRAIIATGLVSSVSITPRERTSAPVGEPATVDLVVALTPAPPRTIAGQVGYSTTDGIRVEASWQHRNLIRPQGQVTFRGVAGTEEQRISADLRQSNWKQRDRTLGARIEASVEDRDAFFARTLNLEGFIERETNLIWQKSWIYRFGGEFLASQERDRSLRIAPGFAPIKTFLIAAAPLQLTYDGSDDLLDPKRGFRLTSRASPELSFQDSFFGYVRAQVESSAYLPLLDDDLVLAGRIRFGTIFGADRSRIAPSRRFYAGGGGSVRGYGFQDVGPRDADNDPLGGRSIVEFSAEARYRFGSFGIVPFIDAGQVDTRFYPRFKDLQFGAGIGARYYTNFGPIRLDVATPLNRRPGDPRVAVYVSIGQAF